MILGSLFDGIGGFPLAGAMCGIRPVWSSEIEPFPLKVTAARFPDVKQLGSVTDIDGAKIEPVDVITFGSPCQDLSVAGKQLGIHEGQRSNLFFEAVRIIKEMRDADTANGRSGVDIRPRFAVWENVPGAFSSNRGADFKAVLEALAGVREDGLDVPQPKRWNTGGGILGNGWSLAWRVYDAQYWGVPQRRKRIYLVADFAGERAPEILFEREGVRGDSAQGGKAGEGAAADAEGGAGGSGGSGLAAFMGGQGAKARSIAWCDDGTTPTVRASESGSNQVPDVCYPAIAFTERGRTDGRSCETQEDVMYALTCPGDGGRTNSRQVCYAIQVNMVDRDTNQNGPGYMVDDSPTLNTVDRHAVCIGNGQLHQTELGDKAGALNCMHDQRAVLTDGKPPRKYIVRRLTPTECARLQGFPDEWCEGLGGSDSAIYKAYGNGLALPCAYDVMSRIARFVETEVRQ